MLWPAHDIHASINKTPANADKSATAFVRVCLPVPPLYKIIIKYRMLLV